MKIRNGFVSNSSTSSFVLLTSKTNHDRVYEQLTDKEKKVIDALIGEGTWLTVPIVSVITISSDSYSTMEDLEIDNIEIDRDEIYGAWNQYQKLIKEHKDAVFTTSIDM